MRYSPGSLFGRLAQWLAVIVVVAACGGGGANVGLVGNDSDAGSGQGSSGSDGSTTDPGRDGGAGADACKPIECKSAGANCGTIADGCGAAVHCGQCGSGESCGGSGAPNVCGPGTCVAKTCGALGKNCGQLSDGCSELLECGACTGGQVCGAGGPNVCGTGTCTPATCAGKKASCGTIADGCGGTVACGGCTAPELCGIDQPNVCSLPCPHGCPTGFVCQGGTCAGGSPSGIALNVPTLTAGGTVTLNGSAALSTASCGGNYYAGAVRLTETTAGYSFLTPIACNTNTWSIANVYPGTYKVEVSGQYYSGYSSGSNIPATAFIVNAALVLNASATNVALNVPTLTAGGTVTLNGSAALSTASCGGNYYAGAVRFTERTAGYSFLTPIACNTNTWSIANIYPGTYKVEVSGQYYSGYSSGSKIPATAFVAVDRIAIR